MAPRVITRSRFNRRVGAATRLETSRNFSARYRLHVAAEVANIDNQNGHEVITLSGTNCGQAVVSRQRAALRGNEMG